MAELVFRNVTKDYGSIRVVDDFNLTIHDKEFIVLVGPSGCGKTTTPVSYTHLDVYKRHDPARRIE